MQVMDGELWDGTVPCLPPSDGIVYLPAKVGPLRFAHVWFPWQSRDAILDFTAHCHEERMIPTFRAGRGDQRFEGWRSYELATARVDLRQDPWPTFKKEQRTATRKFERSMGTIYEAGDPASWSSIEELRRETYTRNGLAYDVDEFERLKSHQGFVRVYGAEVDGELAGGAYVFDYDDCLYLHSLADKPEMRRSNPSSALVSYIALLGYKKGYRVFDLGGVDLRRPERYGINRFKLSFGDIHRYRCFSPAWWWIRAKEVLDGVKDIVYRRESFKYGRTQ